MKGGGGGGELDSHIKMTVGTCQKFSKKKNKGKRIQIRWA